MLSTRLLRFTNDMGTAEGASSVVNTWAVIALLACFILAVPLWLIDFITYPIWRPLVWAWKKWEKK